MNNSFIKAISKFLVVSSLMMLTGCGHSVARVDRGTGLALRIPLPDGSSLIDFKMGKIDSSTTVLRGGASYDSLSSTGGSLMGTGGTSDRMQMSTIPGINEGYLEKVMVSPNAPESVKLALVTHYLGIAKPDKPLASRSVSVGSAVGTGDKVDEVKPEAVGIDNAINKAAEVAPKIAPVVGDTTIKVVDATTDAAVKATESVADAGKTIVKDTTEFGSKTVNSVTKLLIVVAAILLILVSIAVPIAIKIYKKKKASTELETKLNE